MKGVKVSDELKLQVATLWQSEAGRNPEKMAKIAAKTNLSQASVGRILDEFSITWRTIPLAARQRRQLITPSKTAIMQGADVPLAQAVAHLPVKHVKDVLVKLCDVVDFIGARTVV